MLPHETDAALYAAFVFLGFGFLMMFVMTFKKLTEVKDYVEKIEEDFQSIAKQNDQDGFILRRVKIDEEGETVDFDNE